MAYRAGRLAWLGRQAFPSSSDTASRRRRRSPVQIWAGPLQNNPSGKAGFSPADEAKLKPSACEPLESLIRQDAFLRHDEQEPRPLLRSADHVGDRLRFLPPFSSRVALSTSCPHITGAPSARSRYTAAETGSKEDNPADPAAAARRGSSTTGFRVHGVAAARAISGIFYGALPDDHVPVTLSDGRQSPSSGPATCCQAGCERRPGRGGGDDRSAEARLRLGHVHVHFAAYLPEPLDSVGK